MANGLAADVVTMNQTSDIELLVKKRFGQSRLEHTPAGQCRALYQQRRFLGAQRTIRNTFRTGGDLAKDGVQIVLANPKTTGNGRYAFLGAYGYGLKVNNGDEGKTKGFCGRIAEKHACV